MKIVTGIVEYDSTTDKVKLLMERFELDEETAVAVVSYLDDAKRALEFQALSQVLADYGLQSTKDMITDLVDLPRGALDYNVEPLSFDDLKKYADADGRFADGFTKKGSDE